jgi:hypothetical protein
MSALFEWDGCSAMARDSKENAVDMMIGRICAAIVMLALAALALFAVQNRQSVFGIIVGVGGTILFRWWRGRVH